MFSTGFIISQIYSVKAGMKYMGTNVVYNYRKLPFYCR